MKKGIITVIAVAVLITVFATANAGFSKGIFGSILRADPAPMWPMAGYNAQRTGQCPYDVSGNNGIWKWKVNISGGGYNLLIGPDGTIYAGNKAINSDGTINSNFPSYGAISAIGSDGTLYVPNHLGLYAINPDGTQKWTYSISNINGSAKLAIAQDGTIYVPASDGLYAVNPDGTLKWKYEVQDNIGTPSIGPDGTIYVGGGTHFYAINPDGTLKYRWNIATYFSNNPPVIGKDGTIYLIYNNRLQALAPDGNAKWIFNNYYFSTFCRIVISSTGTIYVLDGRLYALNSDGTLKWKSNCSIWSYHDAPGSLAIGINGTIIVTANNGVFAFNPDGTLKWRYNPPKGPRFGSSSIAISSDGTIYAVGSDMYLYAFGNLGVTLPSAPQNLTVERTGTTVKLSWDASTQGTYPITGYAIYRGHSGNENFLDTTIDASTTTYTDYSTNSNSTYYYYVVALDNRTPPDCSVSSNKVSIGPPDFSISVNPTAATVNQGDSATFTVTLTSLYGFNSAVSLSASNPLATASFNPQTLTPTESGATSTLTLTVSDTATPGTYNINVNASGGGKGHSTPISLTITSGGLRKGDVNGDGYITAQDAILVLRYKAGYITLTDEQKTRADMNGDGVIDETDARLILKKAVGQ